MDPVSGAVGFVASVYSLVQAANEVRNLVKRLRLNEERRSRLLGRVADLIEVLESAGSRCRSTVAEFVSSSLEEVKSLLESLAKARNQHCLVGCVLGCITARDVEARLDEAERKLEILRAEVVVAAGILELQKQLPRISNEGMELPQLSAGLDRAKPILEFLRMSESKELRVIGIHGLPGAGKTTLLNYTWEEASSKPPFAARAYVQIGNATQPQAHCDLKSLLDLQSCMLQQLSGERVEFSSIENGKKKLSDHFKQLRSKKMPVFLAIDNVFEAEDLRKLFPSTLSKDVLPAFSSIAVTCRNSEVIKALLNICHLQEKNQSQVFCFTPPCLDLEESKAVFAQCGGMLASEHMELLDALVPLCKGLPLALTVLGNIFVDEAKRERREWEDIKKQMQKLDEGDEVTSPVTKPLRVSYDKLRSAHKAAFLDVVNAFYGWPWERVERILGMSVMKDLKNSSLISEAGDWTKCNQSALRNGHGFCEDENVVTMHDLILRRSRLEIFHLTALSEISKFVS